jgi:hypothetical protein
LLGIVTAPDDESVLYAYVTTSRDDRIVRMSLRGDTLGRPEEILTGIPVGSRHHGGRLLFDGSGHLFVSTGDAGSGRPAQDRDSLAGKVLRLDRDGRAAAGNPFGNRTWSYGHRNIEALALDADGRLWAAEFGDKSADELNLIECGGNYGWPGVEGRATTPTWSTPRSPGARTSARRRGSRSPVPRRTSPGSTAASAAWRRLPTGPCGSPRATPTVEAIRRRATTASSASRCEPKLPRSKAVGGDKHEDILMSAIQLVKETDMEESAFEIESAQLAEASRLFPARRLAPVQAQPSGDVLTLVATGSDFGRHAWDEAGHL